MDLVRRTLRRLQPAVPIQFGIEGLGFWGLRFCGLGGVRLSFKGLEVHDSLSEVGFAMRLV